VKDTRDRPLFFAGTEENFERFLSAQVENLQYFSKHEKCLDFLKEKF